MLREGFTITTGNRAKPRIGRAGISQEMDVNRYQIGSLQDHDANGVEQLAAMVGAEPSGASATR